MIIDFYLTYLLCNMNIIITNSVKHMIIYVYISKKYTKKRWLKQKTLFDKFSLKFKRSRISLSCEVFPDKKKE